MRSLYSLKESMTVAPKTLNKNLLWLNLIILLGAATLVVACEAPESPTQCPEIECPEAANPEPVLFEELWATSAHADEKSEAFTHWDNEEPPEIPIECAKCHSRPGFIDFLGADGSTAGKIENPVRVGTTITCYACHNEVSLDLNSATFPSGDKIRGLGPEARCIQCHQGLASTLSVDDVIIDLGLSDDDTISSELEFINSHSTSGATPFGAEVRGAYQYNGLNYASRFQRGDEFFSCGRCHDQHTLELQLETCSDCHTIIGRDPKDIRVNTTDFNGDGDIQEGIAYEIESLHLALLAAIQNYAMEVVSTPIAYDPNIYPYFFVDNNQNEAVDSDESQFENRYLSWTPRMMRAAYNYNFVSHDPGAYAHNSTYIIQILHDSLADIGENTTGLTRP